MPKNPIAIGVLLALVASVFFGITTSFVQRFVNGVGPFTTAAALYLGAALMSVPWLRSPTSGTSWNRHHVGDLAEMAIF